MKLQLNFANISASVKESVSDWRWWSSMGQIVFGCFLVAVAFVVFINPYNLVPGGIYGLALVLHNLFPSIQVGTFGYMFDVPLILTAILIFGGKLGGRTIFASFVTPGLMNLLDYLVYPNAEAIEALDPTLLLNGYINLSDHLLLAAIIGGCLSGVGVGIVIRNNAATGGTDIIAMILNRYLHVPFSRGVLIADSIVVLAGLAVIGFGQNGNLVNGFMLSFYSLIAIYISSRVLAFMLDGASYDRIIFIVTSHHNEEFRNYILKELDRSGTYIKGSGMYTNAEKEMIFLVVPRHELPAVQRAIKEYDPQAFMVVANAYNTYGEGFKPMPDKHELENM